MTETRTFSERPAAVRAVAFVGTSTWGRPQRRVRYDAFWADGCVEFDVSLTKMMYRGHPADFSPIEKAVHENCPEIGLGQWVDDFGRVVDGPTPLEPNLPTRHTGRARKFGTSQKAPNPRAKFAWRLGRGLIGLGSGVLLLSVTAGEGFVAMIGALVGLGGVVSLAGLIPHKQRSR